MNRGELDEFFAKAEDVLTDWHGGTDAMVANVPDSDDVAALPGDSYYVQAAPSWEALWGICPDFARARLPGDGAAAVSGGTEEGQVILCRVDSGFDNPYWIQRADSVARIHAQLLQDVAAAAGWNPPYVTLVDDVLTIRAKNRTVVYVIERDQYDIQTDSYRMRWPD